jgi:hypothetical protein
LSPTTPRRGPDWRAALRRLALAWSGALLLAVAVPAAATTNVMMNGQLTFNLYVTDATLYAGRLDNFSANKSGTLRLELWAFSSPYDGSNTTGYRLATWVAGTVNGGASLSPASSGLVPLTPPPAGTWNITLFLTEYTAGPVDDGFDVIDSVNFPGTIVFTATATVVEYYWPARDHYFITAAPAEIAALDGGTFGGWLRTGFTWTAYAATRAGASPVCRFYIPPAYGDSHVYSASPAECADTLVKFPEFVYETPNLYYSILPDTTSGACPAASIPVYRLWNARADTNHRYTTSTSIRDQMLAKGYVAEGYGPNGVAMCAPQ